MTHRPRSTFCSSPMTQVAPGAELRALLKYPRRSRSSSEDETVTMRTLLLLCVCVCAVAAQDNLEYDDYDTVSDLPGW